MKSISLRKCLVVIAVLAAWLAAIRNYAYEPRPYRSTSLIKVDSPIRELYSSQGPSLPGGLIDRTSAHAGSRDAIARALADPAIAKLPGLKDLPDAAAEVGRSLTVINLPGTMLIEVAMRWPSGAEAAAVVNKVVADAVAADPASLRQVNRAVAAGRPSRRPISFELVGLFTLAAAAAILLLLAGPSLLRMGRARACPTCGRWNFARVEPAG